MSKFGFGSNPSDDDDDRRGDQNNPFGFFFNPMGSQPNGAGGMGDLFSRLGGMLGDLGADLSGPDAKGPVNFSIAERIARQQIGSVATPQSHDSQAVAESVRLAELWLDDATSLPAGATSSVAFGPTQWLEETLPTWRRVVTPLADKLTDATMGEIPEEVRSQMGPISGFLKQMNAMGFSSRLGATLGELAKDVVLSTQWGLPLASGSTAAVATAHLEDMAAKLGCEKREVLIYLSAREAAHHRLFQHIPWLVERLILDVEEFAAGLALDQSSIQDALEGIDPESMNNPAAMQEFMEKMKNEDLKPRVVSSNAHARERLETSLSLVEGWVDFVVGSALDSRMPGAALINAGWSSFRTTGSPAMEQLSESMGISLTAPKADEAADLWRRLTDAVGVDKRDAIWDHPDFLPVSEDLDNPAGFIGRAAFDGDDMADFDPIGEIEKLEREMNKGTKDGEPDDEDGDSAGGADTN